MALQNLLLNLGVRADTAALGRIRTGLAGVNRGALLAAGAIAGLGFAAVKAFQFAGEVRATGDELDKTSRAIGLNVERLQELRFAADLAGVGNADFSKGLQTLQKNAFEAARGSTAYEEAFNRLGVSLRDGNGELRSSDDLLVQVAEGYQGLTSDTERSALAQNLFGRAGKRLGPLLAQGAEGIARASAEARELGFIMGEDTVAAAAELTDNQTRLSLVMRGFRLQIGRAVLPILNGLVEAFLRVARVVRENEFVALALKVTVSAVALAMVAAAGKVIIAWLAAAAPFIAIVAVLGLLFLVAEDLFTFLQGGDSVIGDIADAFAEWLTESDSLIAVVLRAIVDFFQTAVEWIGSLISLSLIHI